MGRVERYPNGTFCWVDLGGADLEVARAFYGGLLGWQFEEVPSGADGGDPYTLVRRDGAIVAGMHTHPGEQVAPHWDSYIAVDDLDATLGRVSELGGEVAMGPFEIPRTARIGVMVDPTGGKVGLWEEHGFRGADLVNDTWTWTWNDLFTRDPDLAGAFYEGLFGWRTERAVPIYASFELGDLLIGGMRTIDPSETTPSMWMPYFVVPDADEAAAKVAELGGKVLVPPTAVPAGRFLVIADAAGASCALFEEGPEGAFRGVDGS